MSQLNMPKSKVKTNKPNFKQYLVGLIKDNKIVNQLQNKNHLQSLVISMSKQEFDKANNK